MANKCSTERIRQESEKAALMGIMRLQGLFLDESAAPADVLKGLSLLFERIYRPEAPGADTGFEIRLSP